MNKTVCVIGLGYIGLPTATLLARSGYRVFGIDIHQSVVDTINGGGVHIVEPDLDEAVHLAVAEGQLTAHVEPREADIFMICVPTPFHDGDIPTPNVDYVVAAARAIAPHLRAGALVILESTSPVGTTQLVADTIAAAGVDIDGIHFAYCPERVLPGKIMTELLENDRVVGGINQQATQAAAGFYRTFVKGAVLETTAGTAEMCKLVENSFRDVNIAFANEISLLSDNAGIDVWELIALANRHPRVNILNPGTGVGGHCIAVDPWFLVSSDPDNARLIRSAREVNDRKTHWVVDRIAREASRTGKDRPRIVCLGLAFKANIDDLRESPALEVVEALLARGCDVVAVEPNIEHHASVPLAALDPALADADLVAILVPHREFIGGVRADCPILDFCGATAG